MKYSEIQLVDDELGQLGKRGDDEGLEFEEPWLICHTQNCRKQVGQKNGKQYFKCVSESEGCENLGEVWCCCELFRYDTRLPKDERKWEHVPDGREWKRPKRNWKYNCFCVHTIPWDENLMDCN